MMIAGNINQSKRILERFDEVLYGPAPESFIEDTHRVFRELLVSKEEGVFLARRIVLKLLTRRTATILSGGLLVPYRQFYR